jgi:type 1 glutamine amidotransferase
MKPTIFLFLLAGGLSLNVFAQKPAFRVLAFYTTTVESDHVDFARDAIKYFSQLAVEKHFQFDTTTDWSKTRDEVLRDYEVVVWLNEFPQTREERAAFERYMEGGGAWLGFHVAGYNDQYTHWPWFVTFFGGAVFYNNSWPPLPAKLIVNDTRHPVTKGIPARFVAPINEWYGWRPSPRLNKEVKVLVTLDPANYPLGKKDQLRSGDIPVVWTNTRYKMLYLNMGHGDQIFTSPTQNKLFENAIGWLGNGGAITGQGGGTAGASGQGDGSGEAVRGVPGGSVAGVASSPVIYINQVGFDCKGPKMAVVGTEKKLPDGAGFSIVEAMSGKPVFSGKLGVPQAIGEWAPGKLFYQADFSTLQQPGKYRMRLNAEGKTVRSDAFVVEENALARLTLSSIIHYYHKQRANTPQELEADAHLLLQGSDKTVDLRGGWCDASGDVSKYFSHLAYANFMSPQQTPLVTWSMASVREKIPKLLGRLGLKDSLESEALYGADYMMRCLSKEDYFYMIVFSYFNKDPHARRVVGLLANSVTTDQYQCAFREGGGMAIAALARISQWKKDGAFTWRQYLDGAERAFAHLLVNNTRYDDDGKENIIDDYCALMAATELWIATDSSLYRDEARKRAGNLEKRMSAAGYFIADDSVRPYWHASDAGLPVVALSRYLAKEADAGRRAAAMTTIRQALAYNLSVTGNVPNPYGYARQSFLYRGAVKDGFFIPHENETGWWWQGENARLASLATAALVGGRWVYPAVGKTVGGSGVTGKLAAGNGGYGAGGVRDSLAEYAERQLSWILGCNPYAICFLYQYGSKNTPYMQSNFGHGSERGGISNGITGKKDSGDGSGIDFRTSDDGNEWRWTEQWIPHAAWFLQAIAAMAEE